MVIELGTVQNGSSLMTCSFEVTTEQILHLFIPISSRRLLNAFSPAYSLVSAHININCTGYEYKKRNWVLRLFCDRATVCMVPLSSLEFSGSRTYLRDRS